MSLEHTRDVQRFKRNRAKAINKRSAQFVLKVFALIGYPFVQGSDGQAGCVPVLRAFALAAQLALSNHQTALAAVQVFGVGNLLTRAQGSKSGQAQVNPYGLNGGRRVFDFYLNLNGDEVY